MNIILRIVTYFFTALYLSSIPAHAVCAGKFLNPISDVCWDCIFPMTIGSIPLFTSSRPDTPNPASPLCMCPGLPPRPGMSMGFWEPARLVDVANEPGCFVNLGFKLDFGLFNLGMASDNKTGAQTSGSKYHVHYYNYPLIGWLGVLTDGLCLQSSKFDVAYVSEVDPLWNHPELAMLINPEAILFANPVAEAACAANCVASSNGGLPINKLFWCNGCSGGMYPLTGEVKSHYGGVQSSQTAATKVLARMHRHLLARKTSGTSAQCQTEAAPIIPLDQYRWQITRPIAATRGRFACGPSGFSTQFIDAKREFPVGGESFGWAIWRKRNCCAL